MAIEPDRLVSTSSGGMEEESIDRALRPKKLRDYVGQKDMREQLEISIAAARKRREPLDHTLIFGPPGLGKTTIAKIIANEMGVNIIETSGPVLEKKADLAALLTKLEENDVLFIDEIHRLNPIIEEFLYPVMEDYQADIIIGEGPSAASIKLDIAPFTLIGATTKAGSLTSPLHDRFGIVHRLQYYDTDDLTKIVQRSASVLGLELHEDGAREIACRSRGTPRIANRLLRRVRDYADVKNNGVITRDVASLSLEMLKIDDCGFDDLDRRYLRTIIDRFNGGPVGVDTLAAILGEDRDTLEDVLEPYMMQEGYIQRTPRGRTATNAGGVVYNANYVKFLERARTEWLRHKGVEQRALLEQGVGLVVASMNVEFRKGARLDDELIVSSVLDSMKGASAVFNQEITDKDGNVYITAQVKIACVDLKKMRPVMFPPVLKEVFCK